MKPKPPSFSSPSVSSEPPWDKNVQIPKIGLLFKKNLISTFFISIQSRCEICIFVGRDHEPHKIKMCYKDYISIVLLNFHKVVFNETTGEKGFLKLIFKPQTELVPNCLLFCFYVYITSKSTKKHVETKQKNPQSTSSDIGIMKRRERRSDLHVSTLILEIIWLARNFVHVI